MRFLYVSLLLAIFPVFVMADRAELDAECTALALEAGEDAGSIESLIAQDNESGVRDFIAKHGSDLSVYSGLLTLSAKCDSFLSLKLLVKNGADINERVYRYESSSGYRTSTPLIQAVEHRHREIVSYLLNNGSDPNFPEVLEGSTRVLHVFPVFFVEYDDNEMLKILLSFGANPNIKLAGGNLTLLIGAVSRGDVERISMLLDHGADIGMKILSGETAYDVAKKEHGEDSDIFRMLKSRVNQSDQAREPKGSE